MYVLVTSMLSDHQLEALLSSLFYLQCFLVKSAEKENKKKTDARDCSCWNLEQNSSAGGTQQVRQHPEMEWTDYISRRVWREGPPETLPAYSFSGCCLTCWVSPAFFNFAKLKNSLLFRHMRACSVQMYFSCMSQLSVSYELLSLHWIFTINVIQVSECKLHRCFWKNIDGEAHIQFHNMIW